MVTEVTPFNVSGVTANPPALLEIKGLGVAQGSEGGQQLSQQKSVLIMGIAPNSKKRFFHFIDEKVDNDKETVLAKLLKVCGSN
jgi:hypothetical protein